MFIPRSSNISNVVRTFPDLVEDKVKYSPRPRCISTLTARANSSDFRKHNDPGITDVTASQIRIWVSQETYPKSPRLRKQNHSSNRSGIYARYISHGMGE